jgi:hypothetical protein
VNKSLRDGSDGVNKLRLGFLAAILLSLISVSWTLAQTDVLTLKMSRDFGYGGFNGDIEGLFSMKVAGPLDLARVEFYIDNSKIGEVDQSPFNLQFNTEDYELGIHKLYAIGYSLSGQQYRSNAISANFVPKQSAMKVVLPIMGVILAAVLLSTLAPLLVRGGKHLSVPLGAERKYGAGGGGICPNCHRPFALPLLSAHLGISKLAVCPFCGRWSLVRIESITKLRQFEKAELEWNETKKPSETPDEEKIRKDIDDSKYQGL